MNRGLQIRNAKRAKNAQKARICKEEQKDICRFVTIRYQSFERKYGKWQNAGHTEANGLQVQNKVFLTNGHFKYINNKGVNIVKKYKDIPDWATEELILKYKNSQSSLIEEKEQTDEERSEDSHL